ncbi:MAG: ABC transporter ATP-binding protein [Planctomycetota bacterium]|nr:ABC transporter ATP-binding protein [Planctomycetota bacterium]
MSVLRGASLELGAGEFAALRGASGSGKSTLLWIAGALLAPDGGEVEIAGEKPYALNAEARARFRGRALGFVFQQFHLVPYLSVRDNVLAPRLAHHECDARAAEARADELIERFGLTSRRHHVPSELSTGERQRAALARALLNRPRLLLADEPTGNLDEANARAVFEHLKEFAAGGGAVLMVTHDARAAEQAPRQLTLKEGRLEAERAAAPAQA